jgi:hypothetical protein
MYESASTIPGDAEEPELKGQVEIALADSSTKYENREIEGLYGEIGKFYFSRGKRLSENGFARSSAGDGSARSP